MAFTKSDMLVPANASVIRDTDAAGTANNNVNGAAAVLYEAIIDNSANAAQKVYLKLYDNAAPTIGTTAPNMIVPVPGGATVSLAVPEGVSFATALSYACVTTGGTGGATDPTSNVILTLAITN